MSKSFVCYRDYLDTATRYASSEHSSFPASNLYDQSVRGKVWRSAGYFKITSANKGIVFEETSSTPLTANIAEGEYTSLSALMLAIKTAMESAGQSTYTVTQDAATKRINISSNLFGGGGIFNLLWSNAGSTAYDVIGFENTSNLTGSDNYDAVFIRNHTEERLTWDLGLSSNPMAFIAIGKIGQAIKISENATIRLQGNLTNSWTSPLYDEVLTYDELAIMIVKPDGQTGLHSSAMRYWSLQIVDRENANGYVELSNVFLGPYYETMRGVPTFPMNINGLDFSSSTQFQSGAKSFTLRERTDEYSFGWFGLTNEEKEVFDDIRLTLGKSKPFYLIMDPNLVFSSRLNYSTRFFRFTSPLSLSFISPGVWNSNWSVEEVV